MVLKPITTAPRMDNFKRNVTCERSNKRSETGYTIAGNTYR